MYGELAKTNTAARADAANRNKNPRTIVVDIKNEWEND